MNTDWMLLHEMGPHAQVIAAGGQGEAHNHLQRSRDAVPRHWQRPLQGMLCNQITSVQWTDVISHCIHFYTMLSQDKAPRLPGHTAVAVCSVSLLLMGAYAEKHECCAEICGGPADSP